MKYSIYTLLIFTSLLCSCKNDDNKSKTDVIIEKPSEVKQEIVNDTLNKVIEKKIEPDTSKKKTVETKKSIEDMQSLFSTMFENKKEDQKYYVLNNIQFENKGHKIAHYNKSEIIGLAKTLKEKNAEKIEILVHTNDNKKTRENKKLSKMRAEVILQILKALGVNEKQLSAKGLGNKDKVKASVNRVEIEIK